MYIKYNDKIYELINYKNEMLITSYFIEKIDNNFEKKWDYYQKNLLPTDPLIQDIYHVRFLLHWESGFEKVNPEWVILTDREYMNGDKVLLRFVYGHLPGWEVEEQTVSKKYVDISECDDFTVQYIYSVKDGKKLDEPETKEEKVTQEEFQRLVIGYRSENL